MSRHHPPATEGELDRLLLIVPVRPEPAWFAGPVADLGPRPPHVSAALLDGMGLEEYRAIHGAAADREAARILAEARIRCGAPLAGHDPGDEDCTSPLDGARATIADFSQLREGWTGYVGKDGPPSVRSRGRATCVLDDLAARGHMPVRIAPMACGGVSLRYQRGQRAARVEVHNDGSAVLVTGPTDRHTSESRYSDVTTVYAPRAVAVFLRSPC